MKILVTGGAGFIGSNFVYYELDNYPNDEVINNDINNGESYVMLDGDDIVATTVISFA